VRGVNNLTRRLATKRLNRSRPGICSRLLVSSCATTTPGCPRRLDRRRSGGCRRRHDRNPVALDPAVAAGRDAERGRPRQGLAPPHECNRRRPPVAAVAARVRPRRLRRTLGRSTACRPACGLRGSRARDARRLRRSRRRARNRPRRIRFTPRHARHRALRDDRRLDRGHLAAALAPPPVAARTRLQRARLHRVRIDRLRVPTQRDRARL
jgi:hypothetical protein